MREYGFSLTRILSYKDKIGDFVLTRENTVSENPYSRIFYVVCSQSDCREQMLLPSSQECFCLVIFVDETEHFFNNAEDCCRANLLRTLFYRQPISQKKIACGSSM